MIDISYIITGADAVRRDLARLRLDAVQAEVAAILGDMAAEAGTYPTPLPGSHYERTNALHDGWLDSEPVFNVDQDSLLAVLTNPVAYGPEVQGADDQAAIHQGRWQTVEALMDSWETRVAERIEATLLRQVGV